MEWIRSRLRGGGTGAEEPREVMINRLQTQTFCDNHISTAKYSVASFLPRFLFESFRRYANFYFLIIALLQQIPDVSPTGRFTTAVPLIFILAVSAIKEAVEDYRRHKADRRVNRSQVQVLKGGSWTDVRWEAVMVGDLVKVVAGQFFPADLVLLSSSEPNGMAYVETSNLDGETNLKIRQALSATAEILSHDQLYQLRGSAEVEPPNCRLYDLTANLRLAEADPVPLASEQLLQRGAQLRNTKWIFGLVVYTGHETKLVRNTGATPLKRSNVDVVTNNQILVLLGILLLMSLGSAIAAQIWNDFYARAAWYLGTRGYRLKKSDFGMNFLTFVILYNNLVPISLQVTVEVVRYVQAIFINSDLDMYHPATDTPAAARTSNLNEELGQVKYIFSDKTGTLTRNQMVFKKCSVGGEVYGKDTAESFYCPKLNGILSDSGNPAGDAIKEFLTALAVCHTVVPEREEADGPIIYQASSPDEGALVKGAAALGYKFHTRTPQTITVSVRDVDVVYRILHVLEFNSDRKRMSVVVQLPDGRYQLLTKGADTVVYERLKADANPDADVTLQNLSDFGSLGYRTLCVAKAEISAESYERWKVEWTAASVAMENRAERIAAAADLIEKDLILLGATAIEDKLQEGVPEAIAALLKADIKIWVLTGDKVETAINIGSSCKLISPKMPLILIDKAEGAEMARLIQHYSADLGPHLGRENDLGLVITGRSLHYALQPDIALSFLQLAKSCRIVICCRVTPMQKAQVVSLVKDNLDAITLAIGDGANDVAMIQAAHVGVGISGFEGLQAASASDYSIGQFRFLTKLLFVHGAWSYHRLVKLILYSFHKNICLYIIELWFATVSAWSGQVLFERWTIGLFNVIFTAAPPLAIGLFDRTASAETMMRFPGLYKLSQNRRSFSVMVFWIWILNATYHSVILFWLSKLALVNGVAWPNGQEGGWLMLGNTVYTYVVVTVCLKAALEIDTWVWLTHVAIWGSIASWYVFLLTYANFWPTIPMAPEMSGMARICLSSAVFWLGHLIVPPLALLLDVVYKVVRRSLFKTVADEVREMEMSRVDPALYLPQLDRARGFTEATRLLKSVLTRSATGTTLADEAQHGYAFSQEENGIVTQGQLVQTYDTNIPKPEGL